MKKLHIPGPWHTTDCTDNIFANAALIAAAPEMLDALRFVLSDPNSELDYETRIIINSAIVKATGK